MKNILFFLLSFCLMGEVLAQQLPEKYFTIRNAFCLCGDCFTIEGEEYFYSECSFSLFPGSSGIVARSFPEDSGSGFQYSGNLCAVELA